MLDTEEGDIQLELAFDPDSMKKIVNISDNNNIKRIRKYIILNFKLNFFK